MPRCKTSKFQRTAVTMVRCAHRASGALSRLRGPAAAAVPPVAATGTGSAEDPGGWASESPLANVGRWLVPAPSWNGEVRAAAAAAAVHLSTLKCQQASDGRPAGAQE